MADKEEEDMETIRGAFYEDMRRLGYSDARISPMWDSIVARADRRAARHGLKRPTALMVEAWCSVAVTEARRGRE